MTIKEVFDTALEFAHKAFDDINVNYKNETKNLNVTVNNPKLGGNLDIKMVDGKPVVNLSVGGK